MSNNWDCLLSEFCRLGGIADNVFQRQGKYGRGIFPVNSSISSRIFTPSELLVKKDDVYLEDKKLRIKKMRNILKNLEIFLIFIRITFHGDRAGKRKQNCLRKD